MNKRKKKKRTFKTSRMDEVIRASRRGSREAEKDLLGPGFHSITRVHKTIKTYTRKTKHKQSPDTE